jgi:hypothetical protein
MANDLLYKASLHLGASPQNKRSSLLYKIPTVGNRQQTVHPRHIATNLQMIADMLDDDMVWGFALAGDGSTHRGQSSFDLRMRICLKGQLLNLHLVAIPMFDRQKG